MTKGPIEIELSSELLADALKREREFKERWEVVCTKIDEAKQLCRDAKLELTAQWFERLVEDMRRPPGPLEYDLLRTCDGSCGGACPICEPWAYCVHEWKYMRGGGALDDLNASEVVVVCSKCGMEKPE